MPKSAQSHPKSIQGVRLRERSTTIRLRARNPSDFFLVGRRKEIYESRWPETKAGVAGGKAGGRGREKVATGIVPVATFTDDAASKTDRSVYAVRRQAKIGDALKDMADEVAATPIADNQKELLAVAKLPKEEQRAVVADLTSGKAKSVKQSRRQRTARSIQSAPG